MTLYPFGKVQPIPLSKIEIWRRFAGSMCSCFDALTEKCKGIACVGYLRMFHAKGVGFWKARVALERVDRPKVESLYHICYTTEAIELKLALPSSLSKQSQQGISSGEDQLNFSLWPKKTHQLDITYINILRYIFLRIQDKQRTSNTAYHTISNSLPSSVLAPSSYSITVTVDILAPHDRPLPSPSQNFTPTLPLAPHPFPH